jgi:hypothetical protein
LRREARALAALLDQAPVDADREEVIATWVEMVTGLLERGPA